MPNRDQPAVITQAEMSYDDQFRLRRRRYLIMMSMRIPFLIAAALLYHIPWLAVTLIAMSIPLPWMAVLIANDRPARKTRLMPRGTINHERALPSRTPLVIDESDNREWADAPEPGAVQGPAAVQGPLPHQPAA